MQKRYPEATLVQGDAYSMRRLLETLLVQPASAVVSGLPLVTKPIRERWRLIRDAFDLIDLPMTDHGPRPHGHVLTKNIDGEEYVVFQFWLEKPKP